MEVITTTTLNRAKVAKEKQVQEIAELPKKSGEVGANRAIEIIEQLATSKEVNEFVENPERKSVTEAGIRRIKQLSVEERLRDNETNNQPRNSPITGAKGG